MGLAVSIIALGTPIFATGEAARTALHPQAGARLILIAL